MTELNPCPICKGKIELSVSPIFGYSYYKFWCKECGMEYSKLKWEFGDYTKSDVIEDWNGEVKE